MSRNNSRSLNMPLQIRRGTNAQRQAMTQALAQGELLYVTDDQRLYIGNGSTLGGVQITGYTNEDAQDAAAQLFTNGAPHTGITFTYNDAGAGITAVVDLLNNTGTIGGVFKGNVVAEDSTLLIDAASGQIVGPVFGNVTGNLTGNVTGNAATATVATSVAITATNSTAASHFITFVDTATGNENLRTDTALTYNPSTDTLTSGTFAGNVVGNTFGVHTGDVIGSVFADNSSVIINGITTEITTSIITAGEINSGVINGELATEGVIFYVPDGDGISLVGYDGTLDSKVGLSAGDYMSTFSFKGWSTPLNTFVLGAAILAQFDATADMTKSAPRANLSFGVGDNTDGVGNIVATIDYTGKFQSKGLAADDYVKLPVFANDAARSAAITTPQTGMMVFMTAGTTPPVTNKVVVYDSAAWVALH